MKTSNKINYAGGMISLIFIPMIFWIYAKPSLDYLNLRALDLGLPYKIKSGENATEYSTIPIEGYSYKTVQLPTNFDEKTEKKYFEQIKKIQKENIDKTGIKFQFSDNNNYNDLVRLINLMLKTKQDFWGLDTEKTNAFYVVHRKFDHSNKETLSVCGGVIFDYINQEEYDFKKANFLEKLIKYSPNEIYYLLIGYLILVLFSIKKLIKFNK